MNIYNDFIKVFDKSTMSIAIRKVLDKETENGMIIANRFRYIICFIIAFGVIILHLESPAHANYSNFLIVLLILIVAIVQSFLLKNNMRVALKFSYVSLFFDFLLIFGMIMFQSKDPDGVYQFVVAVKNTNYWIFILYFMLQILQLRIKMLTFPLFLPIAVQMVLIYLALSESPVITSDFFLARMSSRFHLAEAIVKRPLVVFGVGILLSYLAYRTILMLREIGTIQQQKFLLSRYFSPKIVEEITANSEYIKGGQRQKVTVLFTDIRGFTKLSEKLTPSELVDFLSEFRERMSNAIFKNGGSVDKFIGDAIMGIFGTPKPSKIFGEDSENAFKAGLEMFKQLNEINNNRVAKGYKPINIGIGIHTGEVIAGNIGEGNLLEYTVIGDAVNTASRIESLCKKYNDDFIVSKAVYDELNESNRFTRLPDTLVKGKELPLEIYKVNL